jgi:hypothetical protein
MNSWTPLFSSIVDSSVWSLPDPVRIVWVTMLALKDRDHVVRYNAYGLSKRANKTEAEVLAALDVLSKPDLTRLEPQPFEGRRIERVADGWLMLNGQKYRDILARSKKREADREAKRLSRASMKLALGAKAIPEAE